MRKSIPTLLLVSLLFAGCSKSPMSIFTEAIADTPIIDREIKQEHFQIITVFKGKNSINETYAHPIQLEPETIASVMRGISYQQRNYSRYLDEEKSEWSLPMKLFSEKELAEFATAMSKIFAQLNNQEEAYFYIQLDNRIEGKTYITPDAWYWYIRTINDKGPMDNKVSLVKEWKLNLTNKANYIISHSAYEPKKINVNWISIPLPDNVRSEVRKKFESGNEKDVNNYQLKEEYSGGNTQQERPSEGTKTEDASVVEKKIDILVKLRAEGIISEQEYQTKLRALQQKQP